MHTVAALPSFKKATNSINKNERIVTNEKIIKNCCICYCFIYVAVCLYQLFNKEKRNSSHFN